MPYIELVPPQTRNYKYSVDFDDCVPGFIRWLSLRRLSSFRILGKLFFRIVRPGSFAITSSISARSSGIYSGHEARSNRISNTFMATWRIDPDAEDYWFSTI